ncbi:murein hydrolase activator EnvC family protein [Zongyangia hominis]|uniref:Peptidoglycan DD-metalloendopeptidase family protein n=1 Tax=Zongyangia hominis TaxID=2763677 RepID=A0A926EAM4_9FIRM|nr:peptidoglycan DD-metalloendopeptidase family protein [Zongyangia hominis]MBC8571010.1 peptidoglycan DD-metalloendopeptidase family protein [Zongyangia hominis]
MRKHHKRTYKLMAVLLCLSILFASGSAYAAEEDAKDKTDGSSQTQTESEKETPKVDQGRIDELQDQLNDLKAKQDALQQEIDNAKTERDKKLAEKKQLDSQISLIRQEISVLSEKIGALEDKITATEENITVTQENINRKEENISQNYELFKQRLKAMYMRGEASSLGLILGADSFYDFLTKSEVVKRITEQDKELIENLKTDKAELEEDKASLEKDMESLDAAKSEVESDKADLSAKKKDLDNKVAQTQKEIDYISQLEQQYLDNQATIKKQMDAASAEISQIIQNAQNNGSGQGGEFVGGEFRWPLPGFSNITSYYGWRFNHTDFHTGIDISGGGVYGAPIVAANDGTVIKANLTYVDGVGYGKYVLIDHGGGYSTLYAHTSSIAVSEGQKVSRGDTIAYVGSTGWSTGAHLHFEIRVGGSHTNPLPYLQG